MYNNYYKFHAHEFSEICNWLRPKEYQTKRETLWTFQSFLFKLTYYFKSSLKFMNVVFIKTRTQANYKVIKFAVLFSYKHLRGQTPTQLKLATICMQGSLSFRMVEHS